jgi:hypothetical protein
VGEENQWQRDSEFKQGTDEPGWGIWANFMMHVRKAGRILRTSTRPTMNLLLLLRVSVM